jgi:hypothetical protein
MTRLADLARLVAAGLFLYFGVLLIVVGLLAVGWTEGRGWLSLLVIVAVPTAFGAVAFWLFNPKGTRALTAPSVDDGIAELERRGLIVDTRFEATRAFGVESYDDEGPHYFLELADGSGVLALVGQYLYGYEAIDDDPELNRSRRFPCTAFTVRRHRSEHHVVDVICGGDVIEPEAMAPGRVVKAWFRDDFVPEDGEILTGTSFDELKRRLTGAPP